MQQPTLEISLEYCAPCGYTERVLQVSQEILGEREIEHYIASWTLIPSQGGCFELTINGELVFSKKSLGRHAEPGEVASLIRAKLADVKPQQDAQIPLMPS